MDATVAMMVGMFVGMLLGVAGTWVAQRAAEMRAEEDGYAQGLADGERAGGELRRQLDAVQTQLRNRNADIAELRARLAAFEGGA